MTLQQIAQALGAIGVIASLIYVAIQIRNSARATRVMTGLDICDTFGPSRQ